MRLRQSLLNIVVVLGMLLAWRAPATAQSDYTPPSDEPGPAVDKLYFRAFNVDRAPLDLAAGEMDLYYYNLKIAAARQLRDQQGIRLYEAPANTLSLILNPAPAPEGQLNPFSILEVRQAMQRLIDRDYVAREIYQGQAMPMYTPASPTDFDYLTVFDLVQEADLRYDPDFARQQIADAMTEAGAELVDGVWTYAGRPVRIKMIIRVEDERRDLGDLLRTALGEAGFQVDANYQPFAPAIQTVYSTDPKTFGWHIYTEGWGRGSAQRYDFSAINSYYAPWLGNMPGWREVGFWQYENAELDELGQKLFRGEFQDQAGRDEMYREMTRMGLDESVRIWVATVNSAYPVQADVQGITQDIAAGPRGLWTLRTAYRPGSDELTVGHLWVWTERSTWNPVGGIGDVYSSDIARQLNDPAVVNDPFTGIPGPFRATYEVETAGPDGKLDIPADAILWDATGQRWKPVGEGAQAVSKVTYDYAKYFQAPWHHGQPITMADVLYSIQQGFDISYNPDKARIETVIATTSRPLLQTIKGYRIVDDHTIEAYVDFWHFEPNLIASYAVPSSVGTPWELLYAMDKLVFEERRAAYSDTAAARYSVPWLSLVLDRDARLVRRTLLDLQNTQAFPENVFTVPMSDTVTLVDAESAVARYTAALQWFDDHGHLVIGNGPFFLARYDPPAQFAELDAFRDPNYPFTAADFYRGLPQLIEFTNADAPALVAGEPFEATATLSGPGTLGLRYLLTDPASGAVVAQGEGEADGAGKFTIALDAEQTADLDQPLYQLVLAGYSDQLARMAERTVDLEADLFGLFGAAGAEPAEEVEASAAEQVTATAETTATDGLIATAAVTTGETVTASDEITATAEITASEEMTTAEEVTSTEATTETEAAQDEATPTEAAPTEPPAAVQPTPVTPAPTQGGNTPLLLGLGAVVLIAIGAFFFLRRRG
jgi:peptide/nickel transport system substrate-binding protein